jgi:hypothetical protein
MALPLIYFIAFYGNNCQAFLGVGGPIIYKQSGVGGPTDHKHLRQSVLLTYMGYYGIL